MFFRIWEGQRQWWWRVRHNAADTGTQKADTGACGEQNGKERSEEVGGHNHSEGKETTSGVWEQRIPI